MSTDRKRSRLVLAGAWLVATALGGCRDAVVPAPSLVLDARGIVVDAVVQGTLPGASVLTPGDVLLTWHRESDPGVQGGLDAPFDWYSLRVEEQSRGAVEMTGLRDDTPYSWTIEPGRWRGVTVRPRFSAEQGARYQDGRDLVSAGDVAAGLAVWRDLGARLADAGDERNQMWLEIERARVALRSRGQDPAADQEIEEILAHEWQSTARPRDLALSRRTLCVDFLARGEREQARRLCEQALVMHRAINRHGLQHGESLMRLAIVERSGGDMSRARDLFAEALAIFQRQVPGTLAEAAALGNLGNVAMDEGDLDRARERFEQALAIFEATMPLSLPVASGLNNLGNVAWKKGDLSSARALHLRALDIRQKIAPDGPLVATSLGNLGLVARALGDLVEAERYQVQAFRIVERLAPYSLTAANSLNNLGLVYSMRGDLDQAHDHYQRALEVYERRSSSSLEVAACVTNLGIVARTRGDLVAANRFFSRALEIRERIAPGSLEVATSLNNLGNVARDQGDLEAARGLYARGLAMAENHGLDGSEVALALNNLGLIAEDQGDLAQARAFHERALRIRQQIAPASLRVAASLANLGDVASKYQGVPAAQDYLSRALELHQRLAPRSYALAANIHQLADVLLARGDADGALSHDQWAIDVLEMQVGVLGGSYRTQAGYRAGHRAFYDVASRRLVAEGRAADAFLVLERFRARTFLTMLAERDVAFTADIPAALEQARRRLGARYERTLDEIGALGIDEDDASMRRRLVDLDRERGEIEARIRRASPRLSALRYPVPLDVKAARAALDPGTVLLSYWVGEDETMLFTLTRAGALDLHTVAVGEARLREQVRQLRDGIVDHRPHARREVAMAAAALFDQLIAPAAAEIDAGERIVIVPDGPLHGLPFAALVDASADGGDGRFLVAWKPIHTALSVTAYAEVTKRRAGPSTDRAPTGPPKVALAAFGDPSYAAVAERAEEDAALRAVTTRAGVEVEWRPLPHTRREVEGIAALFPGAATRIFLGGEAREEHVKALGAETRIVHLATHAHTDDQLPLNSFVALSIPAVGDGVGEGDLDNGLLHAWEILEQVRLDADLVVLSGCLTGMGQALRGEGLIGLTRAFQYAGARSLVSTLWSVSDQATAELMLRFYQNLQAGVAKDQALRQAQLALLEGPVVSRGLDGVPVTLDVSAPFYWAGVHLHGDWR